MQMAAVGGVSRCLDSLLFFFSLVDVCCCFLRRKDSDDENKNKNMSKDASSFLPALTPVNVRLVAGVELQYALHSVLFLPRILLTHSPHKQINQKQSLCDPRCALVLLFGAGQLDPKAHREASTYQTPHQLPGSPFGRP